MKKIKYISLLGLPILGLSLASCSSKEVEKTDILSLNSEGNIGKISSAEIIFKENSSIPYVLLDDGVKLMSMIRSANLDSTKYFISGQKENESYIISNEKGAKCTINKDKQTLVYDDYDKFSSMVQEENQALALFSIKKDFKALKQISSTYDKGNSVTIDLNPYSRLDVYEKDDKMYLPLSVYNNVLLNKGENVNLAYNGVNLFLITGDSLSTEAFGIPIETELGAKFREGASKETISQEYLEYYYQSLCFDFDYEYGLKEKFDKFDDFLTGLEKKSGILSTNPKQIDNYTSQALSYLNDGHTALTEFSNMYKFGEFEVDEDKISPIKNKWYQDKARLENNKKNANIKDGIQITGDTAILTFSSFTNINEELLYKSNRDNKDDQDDFTGLDDWPGLDFGIEELFEDQSLNTGVMFNKLYTDLTTTYKDTVNNVVIDLTTNTGGSADGLIYALSVLIGDVSVDMTNPLTGGHNKQVFRADINKDGVVDNNDKSLIESNKNIYFLNSKYSFSSANAMPYLAKLNNSKVINLGDKTGGGPCAVRTVITPLGSGITSSSLNTLSKYSNGKYTNLDDGINADHALTEAQMIDRNYLLENINSWK